MTYVKICGNRTVPEAHAAIAAGADAIGILVGPHTDTQKHFVSTEIAREILASLPLLSHGVVVTTYATFEEIRKLIETTGATRIQCHSAITPEILRTLREKFPSVQFIAVIHVEGMHSVEPAKEYASVAHALLLDTAHKGIAGGTGISHDWGVSKTIVQSVNIPVILAGGLNPDNVREAIAQVHPYAVDVRTGVSDPHGDKVELKMKAFSSIAHSL